MAEIVIVKLAETGEEVPKRLADDRFPNHLIFDDGTFAERTAREEIAEEIAVWDQQEVLYRNIDLLPERAPVLDESAQDLEESIDTLAERISLLENMPFARSQSRFETFIDWINPLVGHMPYWLWQHGHVPPGPGAYAVNLPVPSRAYLRGKSIFCVGVVNLALRLVGKRVPTYGNPLYDGGMVALVAYYRNFRIPFARASVRRGDLIYRPFVNSHSSGQGHVAIALGDGPDAPLLQSFWGWGDHQPGLNKNVVVKQSDVPQGYYHWITRREDWIDYKGDEF
jgi:hypothetical protein